MNENSFFNPNFWGMVGALTGVIALILSFLKYIEDKSKIIIEEVKLKSSLENKNWEEENINTKEQLKNRYFNFELSLIISNRRSGQGSVDKPNLLLTFDNEVIELIPRTKEYKWRKVESWPEVHEQEVIDYGRTIYFQGGERKFIELEYYIDGERIGLEKMFKVWVNRKKLDFFILYKDHKGKKYKLNISQVEATR